MLLANQRQHFKALRRCNAGGKRSQGGFLYGRTVCQRIGERNAELKRVGTGFNQRINDFQ